jgi:beta-aspartyl-peptidase (threonine type)
MGALGCSVVSPATRIKMMLDHQATAWNRGDIDAFMSAYWRSPDLTFASGGDVTRGFDETLQRYRNKYPTPEAMGRLTFSDLEIQMLGRDRAMVLGRWHLDRKEPVGGLFTLVMRRERGRWIIMHDHTSRADH